MYWVYADTCNNNNLGKETERYFVGIVGGASARKLNNYSCMKLSKEQCVEILAYWPLS